MNQPLKKLIIPENADIDICEYAFQECISLNEVIIPKHTHVIKHDAFLYSTLSKITFLNNEPYTSPFSTDISGSRIGYYKNEYGLYVKNENLIIEGYKGSTAEHYAQEHGFKFVPLD